MCQSEDLFEEEKKDGVRFEKILLFLLRKDILQSNDTKIMKE